MAWGLHLAGESLNQVLVNDTVGGSKECENVGDEEPLIVVESVLPVTHVLSKINLLSCPERGLGLLVHLPDFVVLDGEEHKPSMVLLEQRLVLLRLSQSSSNALVVALDDVGLDKLLLLLDLDGRGGLEIVLLGVGNRVLEQLLVGGLEHEVVEVLGDLLGGCLSGHCVFLCGVSVEEVVCAKKQGPRTGI